jgi:acyl transferase domain-containing protein
MDRLQKEMAAFNPIRLEASHAFHSPLVEPIMEPLKRLAARMKLQAPKIPYLSNVTGQWMRDEDATDSTYWARHLRGTVQFYAGLQEALRKPGRVLLEVGPGKVLSDLARRTFTGVTAVTSLQMNVADGRALAEAAGNLWTAGVAIDWKAYYQREQRRRVVLTAYPFERKSYWVNTQNVQPVNAPSLNTKEAVENWFYAPSWRRAPLTNGIAKDRRWLIFADDSGVSAAIAKRLRDSAAPVIEVRRGSQFKQDAEDTFSISPDAANDFVSLFDSLSQQERMPDKIVYAWDLDHRPDDSLAGFDSVVYLAQAVGLASGDRSMRLAVLGSRVHRVTDEAIGDPARAAALGVVHVLPKENPRVACQSLDVGELSQRKEKIAEFVLRELSTEEAETAVAFRHGHRWIPDAEAMPVGDDVRAFLGGGTYLITHGFQEIGLALAERLVQRDQAQVALLDRAFFPQPQEWEHWIADQGPEDAISRKIARLLPIREHVRVVTADLSSRERVQKVKAELESELGPITGVFHLERTARTGLIQGRVAPVSGGLQNDYKELATFEELFPQIEFLALFASNMAESGGLGQVEQAARTAMVNAFSERLNARGLKTVSIEWGTRGWEEAGEGGTDNASFIAQQLEEKRRRFGMTVEECLDVLERALALDLPGVIISTRNFAAVMEQQYLFTADFFQKQMEQSAGPAGPASGDGHSRPDISTIYEAPRNEVEKLLAEIWKSSFRFDSIGIHDNFFELGGHSLLAVQLLKNMNDTFSSKLALKDLFDSPTIGQLAPMLSGASEDGEDAELEALLAEIEGMSEDKLRAELDSKN